MIDPQAATATSTPSTAPTASVHVDNYTPPTVSPPRANPPRVNPPRANPPGLSPTVNPPGMNSPRVTPAKTVNAPKTHQPTKMDRPTLDLNDVAPSSSKVTSTPPLVSNKGQTKSKIDEPTKTNRVSQSLEEQNIFHLLGVTDGSSDEKEDFLDELQQVIWEDFLENDLELLLTEEELMDFKKISGYSSSKGSDSQRQEKMIIFLEKLIPDLEEIMLEKALELKEDMVRERITGMKEFYANNPRALASLEKAVELIDNDQWREAAELLNGII